MAAHFSARRQLAAVIGTAAILSLLLALSAWSASGGPGLLDGGGFPTSTPTVTPTMTATQPLLVFPTATSLAYPPSLDSSVDGSLQQAAPGRQQAQVTQSSPSIAMLCLPFGAAGILLFALLASRLRRGS